MMADNTLHSRMTCHFIINLAGWGRIKLEINVVSL